jgi:hypothetical protein
MSQPSLRLLLLLLLLLYIGRNVQIFHFTVVTATQSFSLKILQRWIT